jgi:hypothetical protein
MSQLTLYNAVLRTVTIRMGPTDGQYAEVWCATEAAPLQTHCRANFLRFRLWQSSAPHANAAPP